MTNTDNGNKKHASPANRAFQDVKEDVVAIKEDLSQLGTDTAQCASDFVRAGAGVATQGANAALESARSLMDQGESALEYARKFIVKRPGTSMLIGLGVGVLMARALFRR